MSTSSDSFHEEEQQNQSEPESDAPRPSETLIEEEETTEPEAGSGEPEATPEVQQELPPEAQGDVNGGPLGCCLGVVIGMHARHVTAAEAENYIFGYTCVNDVTARDLQRKDVQFTRAKGFDTFCPAGPWIVRREDVVFENLRVRTLLDGEVRQDASVRDMIFPVSAIIAFVTQFMTLEPGDLIATGTPSGVGPMQIGSTVSVEIDGIGILQNRVVAATRAASSQGETNR